MSLFRTKRQPASWQADNHPSVLSALLDGNGSVISANDVFQKLAACPAHQFGGRNILSELGFSTLAVRTEVMDGLRSGVAVASHVQFPRAEGGPLQLEAVFIPELKRSGELETLRIWARDVTEREARLTDLEKRTAALAAGRLDESGAVTEANPMFLEAVGMSFAEMKGRHFSVLMTSSPVGTRVVSEKLARGEVAQADFLRRDESGDDVWIRFSFIPLRGADGRTESVTVLASNVTAEKRISHEMAKKLEAVGVVQAVIEFTPEGVILEANDVFCRVMGYAAEELKGKHHRMFVDPNEAAAQEYTDFWRKLASGEHDERIYRRFNKRGKLVWIHGSYNPIRNASGRVYKVVKFASDVTEVIGTGRLAESAMSDVQSVAAAVEQMTASVNEISKSMQLSTQAASEIHLNSGRSSEVSARLSATMRSMEDITDMINRIAAQVNLLALNATIEAARAGEAGKGFAVVATEVKNLALQTTAATEDISNQIHEAQKVAAGMAESILIIGANAADVNRFITCAASAVEEQSAVSKEISINTQRVSGLVTEIAGRIRRLTSLS